MHRRTFSETTHYALCIENTTQVILIQVFLSVPNSGTFEIYCQAGSHREAGMRAIYNVSQCPGRQANPRQHYQAARIYYIMAEEMEWDYCPDRSWELEWHNQSEMDR